MDITLSINFLLVLLIIEILKSLVTNNYFIINLFFPTIIKSSNKKEILNWLFNLFFFLSLASGILMSLFYFLIYIFTKKLLFLFLVFIMPFVILDFFFIISIKFFHKKKYTYIKLITFFLYTTLFIIIFNFKNYNWIFLGFILITLAEIGVTYFLLKNKLNFKINLNYLNDLRNYYFLKKFIKFFFKL